MKLQHLVFSLAALAATSAFATTYYVAQDGDDSKDGLSPSTAFATLDKGLNTIGAGTGNTLIVGEGTFSTSVSRSLKAGSAILGAGPGRTTIEFTGTESKFNFASSTAAAPSIVKGFTCTSSANHTSYILCADGANYTYLEDLIVDGVRSTSSNYGVIKFQSNSGRFVNVIIRNCRASKITGGLWWYGNSTVHIENCLFHDNTITTDSTSSGANFYWADGAATIRHCVFGRSTMAQAPSCYRRNNASDTFVNCIFFSKNTSIAVEKNCVDWSADDFASKCTDYLNGDYMPTARATDAIDCGVALSPLSTNDIAGARRPIGACSDIGCYEFDNSVTEWARFTGTYVDAGETPAGHCYILTSDGEMQLLKAASLVRYLVAGGGGAGGSEVGGGGGGGQVLTNDNVKIVVKPGSVLSVTVGAGGATGSTKVSGSNGAPTTMTVGSVTVTAIGGGGGASRYVTSGKAVAGNDGANGGGGANGQSTTDIGLGGQPTVPGGFAGGRSLRSAEGGSVGGGGGGAGGAGCDSGLTGDSSRPYKAGDGGLGIVCDITGVALDYGAGGGGGGCTAGSGCTYGKGAVYGKAGGDSAGNGGGYDSPSVAAGENGMANRGGGGGSGGHASGGFGSAGSGGSGVVIIVLTKPPRPPILTIY